MIQKISKLVLSRFRMSSIENFLQQAALLSRLFQCADTLILQFCTFEGVHILPGIPGRDTGLFFGDILIGHDQKNEVSHLLQIIPIGYTIIPDGVT